MSLLNELKHAVRCLRLVITMDWKEEYIQQVSADLMGYGINTLEDWEEYYYGSSV